MVAHIRTPNGRSSQLTIYLIGGYFDDDEVEDGEGSGDQWGDRGYDGCRG